MPSEISEIGKKNMALKLYNTMTRRADEFHPIEGNLAGMYTCGPTVYNYAHIGNLRTYVFEDVLKRAMKFAGFQVKHVMNVTDVGHLVSDADEGEDKMEKGAQREGKTVWEIAEFYYQAFRADMKRLNLIEPDVWCKATDHIAEQIALIQRLEEKGFTYNTADGVYFDTGKLSDYGKLARLDLEGLRAGARVEMAVDKRNPTDFALWKFSPTDKHRLMEWPSPWGVGFPGWHIECSAMAMKYLGEQADIHCGGIDHIPVHHTNEIAQSESATGHEWVKWWMHGEFLVMAKNDSAQTEKMSKSTGGFLRMETLVERGYDPLAYRYFCLNAHYRAQLAFSWEGLDAAATAFERLRTKAIELRAASAGAAPCGLGPDTPAGRHLKEFRDAVEDDLNMPRALAALWGATKDEQAGKGDIYATLLAMDKVLGLDFAGMKEETLGPDESRIQGLIDERNAARKAKNFARADEIRKQLASEGVTIEDTPKGTIFRRS